MRGGGDTTISDTRPTRTPEGTGSAPSACQIRRTTTCGGDAVRAMNAMNRLIGLCLCLLMVAPFSRAAETRLYTFAFANGSLGWGADFADYPAGEEEFYRLESGFTRLPPYLGLERPFALVLAGNNHSDDLCMFLRRKVTGLSPDTDYRVRLLARIASNAPAGAIGIGGAPGESVFVKAGVSLTRPAADPATRLLNIDKGNQSVGGRDAMVIGDIAVATPIDAPRYRFKLLENTGAPFLFRSDASGEAWLFLATDSGFEGYTRLMVTRFTAEFVPAR